MRARKEGAEDAQIWGLAPSSPAQEETQSLVRVKQSENVGPEDGEWENGVLPLRNIQSALPVLLAGLVPISPESMQPPQLT